MRVQFQNRIITVMLDCLGSRGSELDSMTTLLMTPNEEKRDGYVPNVIYTCGAIVHNGMLGIPYAMSAFASVNLNELLKELKNPS